jgi:preprotein translocase subunit SecG
MRLMRVTSRQPVQTWRRTVLESFNGIPVHPLIIHAAVVFVPLLIVGALVYALVMPLRPRIAWAVVGLAVIAPVSCFLSRQSGLALRARLIRKHAISAPDLLKVDKHQSYGTNTMYLVIALGVVTLVLVALNMLRQRGRNAGSGDGGSGSASASDGGSASGSGAGFAIVSLVFAVVLLGLGVASGYYVYKTGDSGAHIVWRV